MIATLLAANASETDRTVVIPEGTELSMMPFMLASLYEVTV